MELSILSDEAGTLELVELKSLDSLNRFKRTSHFVFRFAAGSPAEKEIDAIADEQERCYSDLVNLFGFAMPTKIEYFLLNSSEKNGDILRELTGMEQGPINGFSIGPNYVFAAYCEEVKCIGHHEVTHLFSYQLCMPKSQFLSEGLAVFSDGAWRNKSNAEWVCTFLEKGTYVSVFQLASDEGFFAYPTEITYPISGAFTEFLIQRLGTDRFLHSVYTSETPLFKNLADLFKCSKEQIEEQFKAYCMAIDLKAQAFRLSKGITGAKRR